MNQTAKEWNREVQVYYTSTEFDKAAEWASIISKFHSPEMFIDYTLILI